MLVLIWSAIQMPGTMVPGIWIAGHLNEQPVKVCYSDVFAIQINTLLNTQWRFLDVFAIQFTTVLNTQRRFLFSLVSIFLLEKIWVAAYHLVFLEDHLDPCVLHVVLTQDPVIILNMFIKHNVFELNKAKLMLQIRETAKHSTVSIS